MYTWNATADGSASVATNWTPNGVPGLFDKMLFDGMHNANCTLDTVTKVQDVEIKFGYAGTISIANAQQTATLEVTNTFTMDAPDASVMHGIGGNSTLYVSGAGSFTYTGGLFSGVDIVLGSSTNHAATGKIDGKLKLYNSSRLINYGITTWLSGTISDNGVGTTEKLFQKGEGS